MNLLIVLRVSRNKVLQPTTSQPEEPLPHQHKKFSSRGIIVKALKLNFKQNFPQNWKERYGKSKQSRIQIEARTSLAMQTF